MTIFATLLERAPVADNSQHSTQLASDVIRRRLNQIDKVRARGIADHIALPQIVVCGDQSAGKSSVLEGVTGVPFPRQDGLCTKFATEIIQRHTNGEHAITASIIPHSARDAETATLLRSYSRKLADYEQLPDIIKEVATLMGVRGYVDDKDAPAFTADVLRIEVVGPTGLHLTIVDLPGLISVSDNDHDIEIVESLVDSYLESPRTIILAVVPATSDIETQPIIRRARRFDASGERTIGIITKPDLINRGTEERVVQLANNTGPTRLNHGFFILKNPSPQQLAEGITYLKRKADEIRWFDSWKRYGLNMSRVGIDKLRTFLQVFLEQHIEKELPNVCNDIAQMIHRLETELKELGEQRLTITDQRFFLTKLSMQFWGLVGSAVSGSYQDANSDFFEQGDFADFMRTDGHKWNIRQREKGSKECNLDSSGDSHSSSEMGIHHLSALCSSRPISKSKFQSWILKIYRNTHGRELPGNYNHTLLAELFHEQSSRWPDIARAHILCVNELVSKFIHRALLHVIKEDHVRSEISRLVEESLRRNLEEALGELNNICDEENIQPITYNHYFTDNVQRSRQDGVKKAIEDAFASTLEESGKIHVSNTHPERQRLLATLQTHISVDMDQQACDEATTGLFAYYKVAMKTFVDNICRQVVERHIMGKILQAFGPEVVMKFSDAEIERIGKEVKSTVDRKRELITLTTALREALEDLRSP